MKNLHNNKSKKLIILAVTVMLGVTAGNYMYENSIKDKQPIQTYSYIVRENDTIWNIACNLSSSKDDVNKIEYDILKDNGLLKNPDIVPGQIIKIRTSYK